jgi:DNA polymerase-3 subunit beta
MEFRIHKAEFIRGLRLAQNIADRKSTMPMLANVLLRTTGQGADARLLVAATDLNVSVSAELKCTTATEGGLTVNARSLHDIVTALPGDELTIKRTDNAWAEIRAGKVTYRVVGMPDRDFPKVPEHREAPFVDVAPALLREMIERTLFSVCTDETRYHLNGVLFESNGTVARMVSTDGHRLSKVERQLAGGPQLSSGVIIPRKGLLELKRVLDAAAGGAGGFRIAIKTPYLFVHADDIVLAIKLIDAQFPPYEQVIPKDHKRTLVIDRALLIDALKRAQLMSSETRGVKFAMKAGTLTIASDNPDVGEVKEDLDAEFTGGELSIGFNPKYVIDLLSQMGSDQVVLELGGELDPGLFKPLGSDIYLGVVMPMRI